MFFVNFSKSINLRSKDGIDPDFSIVNFQNHRNWKKNNKNKNTTATAVFSFSLHTSTPNSRWCLYFYKPLDKRNSMDFLERERNHARIF